MAALLTHDHPYRKPEAGPDQERVISVPLEKLVLGSLMILGGMPNLEFHPSCDADRKTRRTDTPAYVWLRIRAWTSLVRCSRNPGVVDEMASCFNFTVLPNDYCEEDAVVAWRPRTGDADRTIDAFLPFAPGPRELQEIVINVLETIFTKTESEERRLIGLTLGYSLMISSGSPSPQSDRRIHSGGLRPMWADFIKGETQCDFRTQRIEEVRDGCLEAAMKQMNRMVLNYYDIGSLEEDGQLRFYLVHGKEQLMMKELSSVPFWGKAIINAYLRPALPEAEPPKKSDRARRDSVE